ncbi:MAG: hypothetical protein QXE77_04355 [Desulfurococcaceae archaeon]|jgi:hypothetical protein
MSLEPKVLRRLLEFKLVIEGPSGWALRELMDIVLDFFNERFSLILNEVLEPYGLEASVLKDDGCRLLPSEPLCANLMVVGVYEKDSQAPLVYALYYVGKGENTLNIHIFSLIDASTMKKIKLD